jgi:carbonic anhydrase
MIAAAEALMLLREGNNRFVSGTPVASNPRNQTDHSRLETRQEPFAVVLGCSDSRVPVEIIFDQGPGDLFVIRVAGNIIAPATVGSIEFAVQQLDTRLVVVLGHNQCGAVQAALDELHKPSEGLPRDWETVIDCIKPFIKELLGTEIAKDRDALMQHAVRANVRASANYLQNESKVLRRLIQEDGLLVLGAEYSLKTGVVDFFDSVPMSG